MSNNEFIIKKEGLQDKQKIESLLDEAFGEDRHNKASYTYRDNKQPVQELCYVAYHQKQLVGTIRFWEISINNQPLNYKTLLLGPLAVSKYFSGKKCGINLMKTGINKAKEMGYDLIILVGDIEYYGKAGFKNIPNKQITMPGTPNQNRLLMLKTSNKPIVTGTIKRKDSI